MNNANAVNFPNTHRYAFGNVNYLYDYYPANRFPDNALPEPLRNIRKALWDFKKGICNFFSRTLVENLVNVIAQSGQFNSERVAVLCVPASSEYKTQLRYSLLISMLKQVLPTTGLSTIRSCSPDRRRRSICRATEILIPALISISTDRSRNLIFSSLMILSPEEEPSVMWFRCSITVTGQRDTVS